MHWLILAFTALLLLWATAGFLYLVIWFRKNKNGVPPQSWGHACFMFPLFVVISIGTIVFELIGALLFILSFGKIDISTD
jgi:hypothetical protein